MTIEILWLARLKPVNSGTVMRGMGRGGELERGVRETSRWKLGGERFENGRSCESSDKVD